MEKRYAVIINESEAQKLERLLETQLQTIKFVRVITSEKTFDVVFDKNIRE